MSLLWGWLILYRTVIFVLVFYISDKLGLIKREKNIIRDEKNRRIYFKDRAAKSNWFYILDTIFTLIPLLFFIYLGENIVNFIVVLLIYYSIFILLMIIFLRNLKIIFIFNEENLNIKKTSLVRKILKLKNKWVLKLNNLKNVYLDKEDKRTIVFDLIDNKFILKIHYSQNKTLKDLCTILNKYIHK